MAPPHQIHPSHPPTPYIPTPLKSHSSSSSKVLHSSYRIQICSTSIPSVNGQQRGPRRWCVEVGGIRSGVDGVSRYLKMRTGSAMKNGNNGPNEESDEVDEEIWNGYGYDNDKERAGKDGQAPDVKHYDADMLTKVIVYAGITALATEILPLCFELVGWGVKSWSLKAFNVHALYFRNVRFIQKGIHKSDGAGTIICFIGSSIEYSHNAAQLFNCDEPFFLTI
ncbi:hypothetical protein BYT27DRAFT_7317357 [Phlegmacium glaucopus]|nr:hypothetical protein BYT27DRAFT_7317357 [Phlegmacium glaucopus]